MKEQQILRRFGKRREFGFERIYFIGEFRAMAADLGKILIVLGIVLVVAGLLVSANIKIPFFGKLPGDIYVKRDNFQFYFPLATSIIVSIFLTALFYILRR